MERKLLTPVASRRLRGIRCRAAQVFRNRERVRVACWPEHCSGRRVQAVWTFAQALYLFSPILVSVGLSAFVHRCDLGIVEGAYLQVVGGQLPRDRRLARMLACEVLERANDLVRASLFIAQRIAPGLEAMSRLARAVAVGGGDGGVQVLARVEEVDLFAVGQLVGREELPVVGSAARDLHEVERGVATQDGGDLGGQHLLERLLLRLRRTRHADRAEQIALAVAERDRRAAGLAVSGGALAEASLLGGARTHLRRAVRAVDGGEHAVERQSDRDGALGDLQPITEHLLEQLAIPSHRSARSFGSRSRLLFDGSMLPTRANSSSPFFGVICVTTQSACCAGRGVQKSPITPIVSSIGLTQRPSASVRSL